MSEYNNAVVSRTFQVLESEHNINTEALRIEIVHGVYTVCAERFPADMSTTMHEQLTWSLLQGGLSAAVLLMSNEMMAIVATFLAGNVRLAPMDALLGQAYSGESMLIALGLEFMRQRKAASLLGEATLEGMLGVTFGVRHGLVRWVDDLLASNV